MIGGDLHKKSKKTKKTKKSKTPIKGGCDKYCSKPKLKTIFNDMKIIVKK